MNKFHFFITYLTLPKKQKNTLEKRGYIAFIKFKQIQMTNVQNTFTTILHKSCFTNWYEYVNSGTSFSPKNVKSANIFK